MSSPVQTLPFAPPPPKRLATLAGFGFSGAALWSPAGPVADAAAACGRSYEERGEQRAMAGLVEQALARQDSQPVGILQVEAATGCGKTLAYLIPGIIHAMRTGSRMLISTHTIALGTQILLKDGPVAQCLVERATGARPKISHMRGRRHFVSPSRAAAVGNLLRSDGLPSSAWRIYLDIAESAAKAILLAEQALADHDTSDAARLLVEGGLIDRIEEARGIELPREDICLLGSSTEEEAALYRLSRLLVEDATVLVTTHAYCVTRLARRALFDSDEDPFGLLVVDEADQWEQAAASVSLVSTSLSDLRARVESLLGASRHSSGQQVAHQAIGLIASIDELIALAPKTPATVAPLAPSDPAFALLAGVSRQVAELLQMTKGRRSHTAAAADALQDRGDDLARIIRGLGDTESDFWTARWSTSLVQGLPSIALAGKAPGRIMKRLWTPPAGSPEAEPMARTILLTSATLSTPGFSEQTRWHSIGQATGVGGASGLLLSDLTASIQPAEYGRLRVRFADPRAPVPRLDQQGHVSADALAYGAGVIAEAMTHAAATGGRTLVLVPSYADVERLAPLFPGALAHAKGTPIHRMIDLYRETSGCCLITPGAWAGVDLPGLIQHLVIPRIPFLPREPGDDVHVVRLLSETLRKLAQGIGRAIRGRSDDVVLWFADPRMPLPDSVVEETGLLPSPHSVPVLLGAIPHRFLATFGRVSGAAAIALPFVQQNHGGPANATTSRGTGARKTGQKRASGKGGKS